MFDPVLASHALVWLLGAMTVCSIVGAFAALFSLGRSGNRKD